MSTPLQRLFGLKALRLAELIGRQGRDAYEAIGIDVDARWNSLIMALTETGESSSSELSTLTGLSRQLVEARIRKMEQAGLVDSRIDEQDARRRLYFLTPGAQALSRDVHEVMADFEAVYAALWHEIGIDLADALDKVESALLARTLTVRYLELGNRRRAKENA